MVCLTMIPIYFASITNDPGELADDHRSTRCLLFFLPRHGDYLCYDNARIDDVATRWCRKWRRGYCC